MTEVDYQISHEYDDIAPNPAMQLTGSARHGGCLRTRHAALHP